MKTLGIDYGEKRIGLAASDENEQVAFEIGIIPAEDFFRQLPEIISQKEIQKIVIGLPLNMSGKSTEKTAEVRRFAEKLKALLPETQFDYADERLSSQMASNLSGSQKNIDGLAAQVFLQNYLDRQHNLLAK
jgi:putative Holliday junction resolvase